MIMIPIQVPRYASRLLTASLLLLIGAATASAQRYLDPIFPSVSKTTNITYGSSRNIDGSTDTLLMDIYQPQGDAFAARPLIIFVHGGGFVGGDKGTAQFVTLCTEFAKRGYVTASINYRLETSASTRAIMNAMHDARAAVRFFRRHASTYRIDTNRIAMGGGSAGAYTSLCVAYIDKQSELYPASGATDVEGTSGNPGYASNIHACLDYWGALLDASAMESAADPPLIIIHGTEDNTVPFTNATKLDARATDIGLYHEFYPLPGEGHGPWNEMDSIVGTTARFLYKTLINSITSAWHPEPTGHGITFIQHYPNPFITDATIRIIFSGDREQSLCSLTVCDLLGRPLLDLTEQARSGSDVTIHRSQLPGPGLYLYRLVTPDQVQFHAMILDR